MPRSSPAARASVNDCAKDRKSTRLNSSHLGISYAVFCLKKKKKKQQLDERNTNEVRHNDTHEQTGNNAHREQPQTDACAERRHPATTILEAHGTTLSQTS